MTTDLMREDLQDMSLVESVTIGERVVYIRPFTIKDLPILVRCYHDIKSDMETQEIDWDNFFEPEKAHMFASVIAKHAPDVITVATGVDPANLPLIQAYVLANKILRINIRSAEGLEKNLLGSVAELAEMIESVSAKWSSS